MVSAGVGRKGEDGGTGKEGGGEGGRVIGQWPSHSSDGRRKQKYFYFKPIF